MQNKDARRFNVGLNKDDHPTELQPGEYTDALNMRVASSTDQQGVGIFESLQGEVELAINVSATYYGGAIGGQFIYEGYEEVVIGNQVWMKYNLNIPYPGSLIYDNNSAQALVYGRLYNHDHVKDSFLIPAGWRVPTEADVDELLAFLGGAMIAGGKLKEYDVTHWQSPNAGATNEFGFQMLPGGMFDTAFRLLEQMGAFWMLDEVAPVAPVLIDPAVIGTDIGSDSVIISWEPSEGADGYIITVSTDPSMDPPLPGLDGLDVGDVTEVTIPGLDPSTPYYVEVTPYNDAGEGEPSDVLEVTTRCELVPIGGQVWMCLNYDADYPGSFVYDDDEGNRIPYGGLYSHGMVLEADFAPPGWKVPSIADWLQLINFVGSLTDAGGILKETGVVYWLTPNTDAVDTHDFGMRSTGAYSIFIPDCEGMCYHSIGSVALLWATDGFIRFDYDTGRVYAYNYIVPGTYYGVRLLKSGIYLSAPVAIAATLVNNYSFATNWNPVDGVLGYYLDVSTDPAFGTFVPGFQDLDVGNVTAHVVHGLSPDVEYYYRVRAYDVTTTSASSNVITVTTPKSLQIESRGDGLGVAYMEVQVTAGATFVLDGTARFYSDSAGTLDESTTWTPTPGSLQRRYVRCPSGTANLMLNDNTLLEKFGRAVSPSSGNPGWAAPGGFIQTNTPRLIADNWDFPNCTDIALTNSVVNTFNIAISDLSPNLVSTYLFPNGIITGDTADFPATWEIIGIWATSNLITGDVANLPAVAEQIKIGGGNTITGDVANLPSGLIYLQISGLNTVYGDIGDLPITLQYINLSGNNTVSGDVAGISATLTSITIQGDNTVFGDIDDIPNTVTHLVLAGSNTLTGDLVNCPTGLMYFDVQGSNTRYGGFTGLPAGLTRFILAGANTTTGNIDDLPENITVVSITGSGGITGTIASLGASIRSFSIIAPNTITGAISDIPASMVSLRVEGSNTISGDLGDLPTGVVLFNLTGNNTVSDYTGKTWLATGYYIVFTPVSPGGLSSAEIDQLLIDIDDDCDFPAGSSRIIQLLGTNGAPTATSAAARASLIAKGVSLDTN